MKDELITDNSDLSFFYALPIWCSNVLVPFLNYYNLEDWHLMRRIIIDDSYNGIYILEAYNTRVLENLNTMRMLHMAIMKLKTNEYTELMEGNINYEFLTDIFDKQGFSYKDSEIHFILNNARNMSDLDYLL